MGADLTGLLDAEEAVRLAAEDPRRAMRLAEDVIASPESDAEARSVAERAFGLAAREVADTTVVRRHLGRAVDVADQAGLVVRAAEARLSLAAEYVTAGRPAAALRELGRASRDLSGDHPQIHANVAYVYTRLGLYAQAVESNSRALAAVERTGDRSRIAQFLSNRGVAYGYLGDLGAAERDLVRARSLCEVLGERFAALDAIHNLAWVLCRRGRLPEALALFDEAEDGLREQSATLAVYRMDRAEALLAAGLPGEATELARIAVDELDAAGRQAELAEALLLRARAGLLARTYAAATAAAVDAAGRFDAQDREPWALAARAVELQARAAAGEDVTTAAGALVPELAARRLHDDEHDVRLAAATPDLLAPLSRLRRSRSARTRARAWQAELLLRLGRGERGGALSAAAAALRALDDRRSGLGATELHASAAAHRAAVTDIAVSLALGGRPAGVLRWSEEARATTLLHAPARPPDDAALAVDLERLRTVSARHQQSLLEGEPSASLHREQLDLEEAVRRRSRHAQATRTRPAPPSASDVRARVGARRVVSLLESGGRLHALLLDRRRSRVVDVCAVADLDVELRHLRLALRRAVLGTPGGDAAGVAAAARIDALLAPALTGDGPLVIVPPPRLAALPWTLLPSVAPYDVEVTPSLAMWCRTTTPSTGGRVAVAGPDLAQAHGEVDDLARDDPAMTVLRGPDATAERVLAALDGAQLAHLACHGRFRADNPLFSSLLLADGPLTVYDVERLGAAPEHLVLSACDSARLGQDLLGLAAAFFSLGTRTLVASVVPVDDTATRRLMVALHRHWRSGLDGAAALWQAQRDEPGPTAAAFVCLTAGRPGPQTVSG